MQYSKPFLTFDEQADLLILRGMTCDRAELINRLHCVDYYRLSGYWYSFKNEQDHFIPGTSFDRVWERYTFDRQLRLVVLDAIERVEVYFRTQLAYCLASDSNPFGYLDGTNLPRLEQQQYKKFIAKCKDKHKHSNEQFSIHFKKIYGDQHELPPYWMLVGMMDFGQVLTLYKGAPPGARNKIANELDIPARVLESWLLALNSVRNICAHHGRLWNRVLGTKPMIPSNNDDRWIVPFKVEANRMFSILTILRYLQDYIFPSSQWRVRLFDLFSRYPDIPKHHIGFTVGWQTCPFWQEKHQ